MTTPTTPHPVPSGSRARLSILIATFLLLISIALIGTEIAGSALAQAEHDVIPSLNLVSNDPGQLTITWEAPQQAPTDYRVRWANTELAWLSWKDDDEAQRANVYPLADVTTLTLSGLTPGDDYKVQMRSRYYNADRSAHQSSGPWTGATARVKDHPPAAPTGLTTSTVAHDSLTLVWNDPQDDSIKGYQILRGNDASSLSAVQANTGNANTDYTDTTVTAETTYHYAVIPLSQDGDGGQSVAFSVTTPAEPQPEPTQEPVIPIDPPTGLSQSEVKHDRLTLIWDDPDNDAITGYRILKGTEPDDLSVTKDDTGSTNTEYTDSDVEKATTYFYSVNALTTNGAGPRSHLDVTTPAESIKMVPGETEQASLQTLVSSMHRTTHQMANLISRDMSQEFRTGSNPQGYNLASIDLYLTGRNSDLTVELRTGSATGTLHATLTPSGDSSGHGVYTFVPPANTTLAADTSYWIMVKGAYSGWFKAALGGDVAPVPGWKLADNYEFRPKYSYDEHGTQSLNTAAKTFKVPGHMSVRINRRNNVATGGPTISGTPQTQQVLTVSTASIQDDDGLPASFNHQWMRYSAGGTDFEANVGTDSNEYRLALADEGKKIRVRVNSFIDGETNDEGPFLSDLHPSEGTVIAPLIYTMVSNLGRTVDTARAVTFGTEPRAQSFTTSGETAGYILTSATILSTDPEGDEFTVKICEVQSDVPTTSCTDLAPPASFTAGPLEFGSPSNRTITLFESASYALVFSAADGTMVTIPATAVDVEDPITLPGWYIRNRSQFISSGQWMDRGYDVSYLIAIKGQPSQISQASGRPIISGNPSVGQVLTASTDSITVPEGLTDRYSYQWKRLSNNGATFEANIGTNSSQYTLTTDELNKKVQVEVSFVDDRGGVVGFPIKSQAHPAGGPIGTPPLISNTSQSGNSNVAMSTEVAQSFTTGPSPHGYQPSIITIFYDDEERRHVNLKLCETSRGGGPTEDCWNLSRPGSFVPGPLNFTVPAKDFRILRPNTTYAIVANGPRPRTVETTIETACPQTDPDFTESCTQEVMVTVIVAAHVGVTTSNGEDTLSSQDWSIRNAYQQNDEGTWNDVSSAAAMRIALHADVAPNKEATGTSTITGTARVGQTLTATTDDIDDPNGMPGTFAYQWKRHSAAGSFEADIGTNSNQYTLTADDVGKKINLEVSFTDLSEYDEGPLATEDYPHGTVLITTIEDDLLVSNVGHPTQETVQATTKVGQIFGTGNNPNGYEITSVTLPGNTATVKICRFETNHSSSPSSNCQDNPSPESPAHLLRNWSYAIVVDPNTVGVTEINEADQTSLPHWSIKGTYQVQNQQGEWQSSNSNRAIRIELRGNPASPFNRLGQLTAIPSDRQVTLNWTTWTPNTDNVLQSIQYRTKKLGETWNPDWTNIPDSNDATATHTLRDLTNGVAHTIELRAVFIRDGQTIQSGSASVNTTPRGPLTAPGSLDASTEGDGGVRLSWSDPADSTLTRYQYRGRNTSDDGWKPDWTNVPGSNALTTSHALTGLRKNIRHTFEVRTLRGDQPGPTSRSSVIPRGTLPHMQNLAAVADDQQVTLSWDNPGDHGITGYQYRHRAETDSAWNPDWTIVPRSNASTTSFTVRPLVNITSYTLEVRAIRGLEEGQAASVSATTPDGPATVPNVPTNLRVRQGDQGFTAWWGRPTEPDPRAPVTSYEVRHRQIGTSSWQSATVDNCCGTTISGLTNRRHYETQVAAANRLGTGPWTGLLNVTPQPPYAEPPGPTGDPNLSLGRLGISWTTSGSDDGQDDSCTTTKSFRVIWSGPDERARGADEWAAHIKTSGSAGEVTHSFRQSPGETDYYEMNGTVNFHGTGTVSLKLRGRFGPTWGTWSPTGSVYCFAK